jgi:hypothetical protein
VRSSAVADPIGGTRDCSGLGILFASWHLRSQTEVAVAQESEAETLLLQSQLEYAKAQNELNEAIGTSTNE